METTTFVLSCISFVLGSAGTIIGIAAYRDGRRAARRALWSDAIEAVSRLSFDVTREEAGDRLVTSRVRLSALIDGMPDRWKDLGPWLAAEQVLGATQGRRVMEDSKANPPADLDAHLDMLKPWLDWNMALTSNLRRLQNAGYDAKAVAQLRALAEQNVASIHAKRGWKVQDNPLRPMTSD